MASVSFQRLGQGGSQERLGEANQISREASRLLTLDFEEGEDPAAISVCQSLKKGVVALLRGYKQAFILKRKTGPVSLKAILVKWGLSHQSGMASGS